MTQKTKDRMIEAARGLFLAKGVEATSVDEILQATKTGKSQFYHYFGSKTGVVFEVLQELHKEIAAGQWNGQILPTLDGWEKVRVWLEAVGAGCDKSGHAIALLTLSIRPDDRPLNPLLPSLYETLRHPLLDFLLVEQAAGRLAQIKCADLADLALTGIVGATIKTVATQDADAQSVALNAHHLTLYMKAYARA